MALDTSYSAFINDFITQVSTHPSITMCRMGILSDLNYPKDGVTITYPYMFIMTNGTTLNANKGSSNLQINLQCWLMDTYTTGREGLLEQQVIQDIQSAMIDIASDIFGYYTIQSGGNQNPNILNPEAIQMMHFQDKNNAITAGICFPMTFRIPYSITRVWPV